MKQLRVIYDERREGFLVQGAGFDFFLYPTGDEDRLSHFECDHVTRNNDGFSMHVMLAVNAKAPSSDVIETLLLDQLSLYWPDLRS
jgi:hypothetical protein